ncbi:hypothetical protein REJC140_01088 [Pseudorhizobium endolithicum]|uniref:DUF2793 domain-containing protein n=1 Tax=Pseudorhizobium endolithicum TaxID=1191678 RepID=A0ABN7JRV8_9HYPH|nr:DUF2793 domain-containing protein [Pseudorhizobium endolithicum]CAD7042073.1 hypothetical protein REJC140_01088 [Pseudorhizobium endolithicum]
MADTTPKLNLPFILPAQAQKHVTHNEALLALDTLVQLTIAGELTGPPQTPAEGEAFLVGWPATGEWAGKEGMVASLQDGSWSFHRPTIGCRAWFTGSSEMKVLAEDGWRSVLPDHGLFETVGINAQGDATNRLALSSPASLFNHAGGGHQLKINKESAADTASLLFQTGFTGRAEIGLAGSDALSIKVSDGITWRTGLSLDAAGRVFRPHQPVMRAYRTGTTMSPPDGQFSGFTAFGINQGGFSLGTAAPAGGNSIVVPAAGLYLACLQIRVSASSGHIATLMVNGAQTALELAGPAGSSGTQTVTGVIELSADDDLTLRHDGTAELSLVGGGTQLSLVLL